MPQYIILVPALIALLYCFLSSSERAFVAVYIPTLLLLPQNFHLEIGGLPDLSFAEWVICVIAFMGFVKIITRYKMSVLDFMVLAYVGFCIYSEINNGSKGLSLAGIMIPNTLLPYLLGKTLLHPSHMTGNATKKIIFVMFINAIICLFQEKFIANPYLHFFERSFPDQMEEWPVLFRYGLVRVGGPMIQPILFGTILALAILLNVWMIRNRLWEKTFKYFHLLPTQYWIFRKEAIMQFFLFLALFLTFSRGPWGAAALGFILMGAGFSKHKIKSLLLRMTIIGVIGIFSLMKFQESSDISPTLATSEEQATALYRAVIIEKYWDMAQKKPLWGYGVKNWPKLVGMKSVDNQYLFLWLKHGIFAVFMFISLFIWISLRLLWRGLQNHSTLKFDTSFAFTLNGCFLMFFSVFFIVFMGLQTGHLFFLLLGWAEGFLLSKPKSFEKDLLIKKKFPELAAIPAGKNKMAKRRLPAGMAAVLEVQPQQ